MPVTVFLPLFLTAETKNPCLTCGSFLIVNRGSRKGGLLSKVVEHAGLTRCHSMRLLSEKEKQAKNKTIF
jgi:hypothetical protein